MGSATDYFRAADAESVLRALERTEFSSPLWAEPPVFDGVETTSLHPDVSLAELVAAIRQVPWRRDLDETTLVWPTDEAPDFDENEPLVYELDSVVRDTLAAVRDVELPEVVDRWMRVTEENGYLADAKSMRQAAEKIIPLARRAREAGEQLFCWACP